MYNKIVALNDQRNFDPLQAQRLGNYVYALKDPRDNKIFYVGQGSSDRIFAHFSEADGLLNGTTPYSSKRARIIDVWSDGESVEWSILAHQLPAESLDHVESSIINALEISQNGHCLNKVSGPHSSFLTSGDVKELGAKPVDPTLRIERLFIFPIHNALATSPDSVYQATRASWKVNGKYNSLECYAVGVKDGISLGSFKIESWEPSEDLSAFIGKSALDLENYNWKNIIYSSLGYWQRGGYLIVELNGEGQFKFLHGCSHRSWRDLV